MISIAQKRSAVKMSATLAINTKVNQLMAQGHEVFHLGFGESKFPVHPKILAAFKEHASSRFYLPVAGLPALRSEVAEYYRRKFLIDANDEQVIVGAGSKSLLFAALHGMDGDVILPSPSWVSYESQAYLTGKAVSWAPTYLEDNYCLTAQGLKAGLKAAKASGQKPAILILNTPHNPTGGMYPPSILEDLSEVAREEDIMIVSDEVYALTAWGDIPHTSMACYYPEGTIVTGGLSKHLSLGGWRLGVAIVPSGEFGAYLHSQMGAVASSVWTTATAPVQYAAMIAYGDDPDIDAYIKMCATIHGYVTNYLYRVLTNLNIPCPRPSGGFYVYPDFSPWKEILAQKHHIHTSQDLANFLLDEKNIASLPGADFGVDPGRLTLRLATGYLYGLNDQESEAVLHAYRKNLHAPQFLKEACPRVIEVGERFKSFIEFLN